MRVQVTRKAPRRRNRAMLCALTGGGLVVISMAIANLKPFVNGDLSVFPGIGAARIILLAGGLLLLVAVTGWTVIFIRRPIRFRKER